MAKTRLNTFLLSLVLATSTFFNVGKSNWIIPGEANVDNITINNGSRAVCYNGRTKTKYTTIEKALEVAKNDTANNDTIYVIPGTNPVITRSCEIASGDTLCLPYEDNGNDVHTFLNRNDTTSNATFGDLNSDNVNKNRKNQITIRGNVSLTNNGTLTVGGSIGYGGSAVGITGQTASSYCEILMKNNSKIINNGSVNLYGYIKESSKNNGSYVEHKNSSVIKLPFVIYDFRGGSYSYACYGKDVMPFSNYDFPNCQSLQKFYYGSKMYGLATIYAGGSWSTPEVLVLGTDSDSCLFRLSNNYATLKYTPSNVLYTTNDVSASTTLETANFTEIHTFGDISLSNLRIELKVGLTITVDTSKMYCPLCFKYQVIVERGTFTVSNKMKFLGGASLLIKSGATVTCNANVSFSQDYIPNIITGGSNLYPSSFTTANLVNNGILNLNSAFGGLVETSEISGRLNTSSGFSESVTTMEILSSKGSSIFASADKTENKVQDALGYLGATGRPNESTILPKSKSFESKGNYWYLPLADITSVTISPNSGASDNNATGTFNLSALVSPAENASSNVTYNWTCDSGASLSSNSGQAVTLTTPANSSDTDKSYKVTCIVNFTKSDGTQTSVTATGSFTATKKPNGCFTKGTLIELFDGSSKKIEDLSVGDIIKTFNHENGLFEAQPITYIPYHSKRDYEVLELEFEGSKKIKVLFAHGFMNAETKKYEEISPENVEDKVGESYIFENGSSLVSKKLLSYRLYEEETECYSLSSAYNLNHIANGALCISDGISGLYNYFELDETFKYDPVKKQQDIDKFGLLSYDEVAYFMSREIYDLFNVKYLSVSIGKGMITMEKMEEYIAKFA